MYQENLRNIQSENEEKRFKIGKAKKQIEFHIYSRQKIDLDYSSVFIVLNESRSGGKTTR